MVRTTTIMVVEIALITPTPKPSTPAASPQPALVSGVVNPGAYCMTHETNDVFIVVNRLLKASQTVEWLQSNGDFCTIANDGSREIITNAAAELGVAVQAVTKMPAGAARKVKPVRLGLYDQYGGVTPAGWTKWLLEQFEFPYEVVYPQGLDGGSLKSKFDVLLFTDEAYTSAQGGRGGNQPRPETIPLEYRDHLGRITPERTLPQIKTFVQAGGTVLTIGSSTGLAALLGVPTTNHLVTSGPDGASRDLKREEFYVPGSLLRVQMDTTHPLANGMPKEAIVFFDNSPVFRVGSSDLRSIATYNSDSLASGWAWGQQHLTGGSAVAEAEVGEGKVILYGPEVAFRAQPHGTFRLLFNGILYGPSENVVLP